MCSLLCYIVITYSKMSDVFFIVLYCNNILKDGRCVLLLCYVVITYSKMSDVFFCVLHCNNILNDVRCVLYCVTL